MLDFLIVSTKSTKRGCVDIYPKFIIKKSEDLMIRGGDFYAVWVEERGLWSTDEGDALRLIDREVDAFAKENADNFEGSVHVLHMWDAESGMIDKWHKYCQKQMRDNFHMLDEKILFSNDLVTKQDYASKRLSYPLESGNISAWEALMSVLYSPEEKQKIEWAIGAIVSGESKNLQKFMVLYGPPKSGKSTVISIIEALFAGYVAPFDARTLGSSSNSFALEAFKSNPLVAIQHDGDLSRIEDNTRLNSLVSHEVMTVNEKFRSAYANQFKAFLIMATNKPVKITDSKSGIIRRLIDVTPTGEKVPEKEYGRLIKRIAFELGGIASHCREVYLSNPGLYNNYTPKAMIGATNDFYNFVEDSYYIFSKQDGTTIKAAWEMYKQYCDDAKVPYPLPKRSFKEELKNYFFDYTDKLVTLGNGERVRAYCSGFKKEIFNPEISPGENSEKTNQKESWLRFDKQESIFDAVCADCPAQEAGENGAPKRRWENVKTKLKDIDTSKLHFVQPGETHIFFDFDIPDENGEKSFEKNYEAASEFPPTYAELSKSGAGIHLHYLYTGDPSKLSHFFAEHIEIKTCLGNSAIRRKLTKCNDLPIATISSGLPLKGEKVVNKETVKSENGIRTLIKRNLAKEYHPSTKSSIDFIFKILEDAFDSGLHYDVSDMRQAVMIFAANSTHQADYCLKKVSDMKWQSEEHSINFEDGTAPVVFFDVEVFINLFVICWKIAGEGKNIVKWINPTSAQVEELLRFLLIGFNNRQYDNHILYGRLIGYTNEQLYALSQRIIGKHEGFFGEAYNLSYTDILDFASAGNKKSLKKLEIEMGIHHQELGLPWDQEVPENLWETVADYCANDVLATEAAFNCLNGDWTARQILADVTGMTVNDTTNTLTARFIFGSDKKPQNQFNYRFMGDSSQIDEEKTRKLLSQLGINWLAYPEFTKFDSCGRPIFPGYTFDEHAKKDKSVYRGETVGEGGYVYGENGIYVNVALDDVESMHPHSLMAEELLGERYTKQFKELVEARLAIKHKNYDLAETLLDGRLAKYIAKVRAGEMTPKQLANALKTAINAVYGQTYAGYTNPFRDDRNKDNIVAKRGALFMVNLKYEVQARGFTVAHIKTDSIKVPNADKEILDFIFKYGQLYGYKFEHEATYDRMCLVNKSTYIAKYATKELCQSLYGYIPDDNFDHEKQWTATAEQFQVPYVFKYLFSKDPITLNDMCETKSVTKGTLYLDMNEDLPDVSAYEKELSKLENADGVKIGSENRVKELHELIEQGHNYIFIGRVGQFCPMKPGAGGGVLYRGDNGKFYAVGGTTGYRWLESEEVHKKGLEEEINRDYYNTLVDNAVDAINQYGSFERFVSEEPYIPDFPEDDELPF